MSVHHLTEKQTKSTYTSLDLGELLRIRSLGARARDRCRSLLDRIAVGVAIEGRTIAHIGTVPDDWNADETIDLTDHAGASHSQAMGETGVPEHASQHRYP